MSYNLTKDNLDSEEESNDYLNQDYLILNGHFPKSNQEFNPIPNIPNLNEIQNIFSIKKESNNIEQSLINNNNKSNNKFKDKKELFQINQKEIEVEIIANKKKDTKDKEISHKNNKKIIFNINHKKTTKKENKDNSSNVSESENEKPKIIHNKFSDDNLRIKCKYIVLSYLILLMKKLLQYINLI